MKRKRLTDKQFGTLVKIFCIFAIAYFLSGVCQAATIKIAVIDTGYDFNSTWSKSKLDKPKLCATGHKFFAGSSIQDNHGHGTHIAGLIAQGNKDIDYCLVIIKVFEPKDKSNDALRASMEAYKYAVDLGVNIINYSGGGSNREPQECAFIDYAVGRDVIVVTAAGNEYSDLNVRPYYPAMCNDSTYKVTARTVSNKRLPASNYTSKYISRIYNELGENVMSLLPNNRTGIMSGTSQATAIFTQKLVRRLYMNNIEQAIILSKTA